MRLFLTGCALVALAACQPAIPDSAAGVGFDNAVNSPQAQKQRDQALAGAAVPPPLSISDEALATLERTSTTATSSAMGTHTHSATASSAPVTHAHTTTNAAAHSHAAPLSAVTPRPLPPAATPTTQQTATEPASPSRSSADQPQTTPDGVVHASPSNPAPLLMNNPGLSDENNFEAVGARRTIDADAEYLANARANYKVIEPTAVPARTASGPNVVAYALSTKHAVGSRQYSRIGFNAASRYKKACAKYPSPNEAQSAFLAKGGPKRDRLGLDPDGDGYACDWDPTPYRNAAGN